MMAKKLKGLSKVQRDAMRKGGKCINPKCKYGKLRTVGNEHSGFYLWCTVCPICVDSNGGITYVD